MLGLILMDFMNGHGSMNNRWLDSLLVHDGLDGLENRELTIINELSRKVYLMDMMMNMLASNDWCYRMGLFGASVGTCVLELHTFLLKTCLDGLRIAVLVLAVLDRNNIVRVLFWQDFTILHRLHGRVVMILMHFTVDGRGGLFVSVPLYLLVYYSRGNFLMNGCVMMTSFVPTHNGQLVEEITRQ